MTSFGDAVRKAMDSELIEPPKGPYKVRLDEGSAFKGKDGREWAKVILEITEGDHAGERFQHFMGFQPPGIAEMNGNACAAYGVDWSQVKEIEDLDDQLTAIVKQGTTAEVSVSYKDGYMNVNVHGSRTEGRSDIPADEPSNGGGTQASFAAAAGTKGDQDIPF
jgi:hypothetical protein